MKAKKEKLSALKKKADSVFSQYIRYRDGGKCITCGTVKPVKEMQAGHYVSRVCLYLRYNLVNVHCQCYACNCMKHGDLITYRQKLLELYGLSVVEKLEMDRWNHCKMTAGEYHCIIAEYTERLKQWTE